MEDRSHLSPAQAEYLEAVVETRKAKEEARNARKWMRALMRRACRELEAGNLPEEGQAALLRIPLDERLPLHIPADCCSVVGALRRRHHQRLDEQRQSSTSGSPYQSSSPSVLKSSPQELKPVQEEDQDEPLQEEEMAGGVPVQSSQPSLGPLHPRSPSRRRGRIRMSRRRRRRRRIGRRE